MTEICASSSSIAGLRAKINLVRVPRMPLAVAYHTLAPIEAATYLMRIRGRFLCDGARCCLSRECSRDVVVVAVLAAPKQIACPILADRDRFELDFDRLSVNAVPYFSTRGSFPVRRTSLHWTDSAPRDRLQSPTTQPYARRLESIAFGVDLKQLQHCCHICKPVGV